MAGNSFGGTIKLTGESDYRKALKDITSDMRLMSSEMKVMATSTDASGKSSDQDRAKKEALSKAISEQRDRLTDLNKALQASVAENGAGSDASKRLQTQVNNATAQLNKMETQLNGTGKETNKLGTEMDGTGKKASIFGDVLKANLASEAIIFGAKKIGEGIVAIGKGLASMVGESIKAFADYEQLVGGVDTLFKDSSAKVQSYADDAYKTAGLSANAYMAQVTSFSATLLQGLGGDTAKASEYADKAIVDMSDNANKMGTDISLIQNAYQGFAKDNYTMLDNLKLGYGGTASEMARLVNDSGVMGSSFKATAENVKDIPFDQLIEALHKTQENLGITGTTAKEASSTISGSFNSVKASWENVLASFGGGANDEIAEAIDGLIESATNLATNVVAILPNVVDGIGQLATALIEQIPAIITTLLPPLMTAITNLVQSIITIIPQLIPVVVTLLTTLVNAIITNLPLLITAGIQLLLGLVTGITQAIPTLIPALVTAITTIVQTLLDNLPAIIKAGIELLVALIKGLAEALPKLIEMIPTIITTIIQILTKPEMIKMLLKASLDIIIALAKGLIQAIPEIVKAIPQIIGAIVGGLGSVVGTLLEMGGQMLTGLVNGFKNGIARAKDAIISGVKNILGGVAKFLGINSPSRYMRDHFGKHMASGIGVGFEDEMGDVAKSMNKVLADTLPSSIDTDIGLNASGLSSSIAKSSSLANTLSPENLVGAIQDAFKSVKIELDDKPLGSFVTQTVEGAVYG
jgi:phage-related protein